jgi:dipeptidyl-peptidase-4
MERRNVRTSPIVAGLTFACVVGVIAVADMHGEVFQNRVPKETESLLRRIYDQGEFRAKSFSGKWLADNSGYTVRERVAETSEQVLANYDADSGKRTVLDSPLKRAGNLSPDGKRELISKNGNLQVKYLDGSRAVSLTNDTPDSSISNGQGVWSPDGKQIAFVQADYSKVRLRAMLLPTDPSYPELKETRFARVGETIYSLRVGVVDAEGGEIRWLAIPAPDEGYYIENIGWAENSNELLVEKLSRFRDKREFLLCDVRNGSITAIFEESDPAWVIASIRKNVGLEWLRKGEEFLVISERDGWRHAYVCSRDGKKQRLLTPGDFDIIERVKVDEARGWFYYNASPDNGTQKYLYRVRLDGTGKPERVTPPNRPGTHDYDFSADAKWAFHTFSTFDTPPLTELVEFPNHRVVRTLENNNKLREKMASRITQPTEFLQLDIGDGVTMDAWMIKPSKFDATKKYPVFVYVYGEPHAQTVLDKWAGNHADYHRAIADLGYLVVSIDNRGTPAPKGAAWRRAVFGKLGPLSTEEQAAGLKELGRTRPFVDLSRVGIWGWSGGGSNTLNAMFRKPDVYHVGIAVAAKPQPHLYNAWFQENYMRTREVNAEGYQQAAAINFAAGLKGNLLIIHGTGETNTHIEIMEDLVDRLVELGKPFDYMTYPNRDHGIRKGRGTTVHLRLHMIRYLLNNLPAGPR